MTPQEFYAKATSGAGCWEWQGARNPDGYGQLWLSGSGSRRAHRVSWMLTNGRIPQGMWVLHECDNPPCVRPDHLKLGTQRDNVADMLRRGRASSGPHNRASVDAVVEAINRLGSIKAAADELGISRQSIHQMFKRGRVRWTYQIVVQGTAVPVDQAAEAA